MRVKEFAEIYGVLPVYWEQGNGSTILFPERTEQVALRTETVVDRMFYEELLDRRACSAYYGEMLGLRRNVPLVLDEDRVFLPVKVRKPQFKNDGAYGFVRYDVVERIHGSRLVLWDGREVVTLHSPRMLERIITRGRAATRFALGRVRPL